MSTGKHTRTVCQICGKPPSPYPNWIIGKDVAAHVGCLADAFPDLLAALEEIAHMSSTYLSVPQGERVSGAEIAGDCLREARAALARRDAGFPGGGRLP